MRMAAEGIFLDLVEERVNIALDQPAGGRECAGPFGHAERGAKRPRAGGAGGRGAAPHGRGEA